MASSQQPSHPKVAVHPVSIPVLLLIDSSLIDDVKVSLVVIGPGQPPRRQLRLKRLLDVRVYARVGFTAIELDPLVCVVLRKIGSEQEVG
jgi:hypothetical protein